MSFNTIIYNEYNLSVWKNIVSPKTKQFYKERKSIIKKKPTLLEYNINKHTATFKLPATYLGNNYKVKVQFFGLSEKMLELFNDDIKSPPTWKKITNKIFKKLINNTDLKFDCTCRAFQMQAHQFSLTEVDSAIKNYNDPGKGIWIGRHESLGGLCKHIFEVVIELNKDNYLSSILHKLKK